MLCYKNEMVVTCDGAKNGDALLTELHQAVHLLTSSITNEILGKHS